MCSNCGDPAAAHSAYGISRGRFLSLAGSSLAAAALVGSRGGVALAAEKSLETQISSAAAEYGVPKELLKAMGYVNTFWEMPPPSVNDFDPGEHGGRGDYGIMQLTRNPTRNTLGKAAALTGISEEELKTDRAKNILGGAALLADLRDEPAPSGLDGWQDAVAGYAGTRLYTVDVYKLLKNGAKLTTSTGERVLLSPQDVEVPVIFEAMGGWTDYRRAAARPAHKSNLSFSNRERSYKIRRVVIHIGEGSFSSIINWFQNPSANVSAHYVVARDGRIAQCVKHKNIAWHAGKWRPNCHSIGIEHAGYGSNRNTWSTAMYRASARLTAYICKRHKIRINRRHIVPHRQISATKCPGPHFNFKRYLRLVRYFRRRM